VAVRLAPVDLVALQAGRARQRSRPAALRTAVVVHLTVAAHPDARRKWTARAVHQAVPRRQAPVRGSLRPAARAPAARVPARAPVVEAPVPVVAAVRVVAAVVARR